MISLKLNILTEPSLSETYAPKSFVDFWEKTLLRLQTHPAFTNPTLNPSLLTQGFGKEPITIDVVFCAKDVLDDITESSNALGVHLVSTPDQDIFNDESAYARKMRVLISSDKDHFVRLIENLASDDISPEQHMHEYLSAYLNTVFHEIAHAVLFSENSALLPPSEIDNLSSMGEIENDLFDCSTAYGIKPLEIEGSPIWADNIEEAEILMEEYVEALGYTFLEFALSYDDVLSFPTAFNAQTEIEKSIFKRV